MRKQLRRWAPALGSLALLGCGSSDDSPAGVPITATCTSGVVAIEGMLDGQPVSAQVDVASLLFQQISQPHTFDLGFAGGMLHMEWSASIPTSGTPAPATGTITMPAGTPHEGETICAGSGTIRDMDTDGPGPNSNDKMFTLETLSIGPSCPGAALDGSLNGCVGG